MNKAIAKVCPRCEQTTWVGMPAERYEEWQMGVNIQKAWPEGSATERETLISGLCPACQKVIFEDENEGELADEYNGDDYSEGLGEPDYEL